MVFISIDNLFEISYFLAPLRFSFLKWVMFLLRMLKSFKNFFCVFILYFSSVTIIFARGTDECILVADIYT